MIAVRRLTMTLSCLLLAALGCGDKASQGTEGAALNVVGGECNDGLPYTGTGPFGCGEEFGSAMWGECNDCSDRGCTTPEEGEHRCRCFSSERRCYTIDYHRDDAGVREVCWDIATQCECDDDEKGRTYECTCEDGVSSYHECSCRQPSTIIDYEYDCELREPRPYDLK